MPVIRWIMNHMVIVLVAALIIVGVIYQDEIQMELSDLGILDDATVANAEPIAPTPVAPSPAAKTSTAKADAVTNTPASPSQMPTHLSSMPPAQAQTAAPAPNRAATAQQPGMQQPHGYAQPYARPPQNFQPPYGANAGRMMPPRQPVMQTPDQGPALDDKVKEKWVAARTAFWQRDMAKAEELYKELVDSSTEADVAGELGNIYLQMRRHKEAADMYFEAAMRYLKSETPMQAGMLLGPLNQLAPEKAEQVRQKLMEHQAAIIEKSKAAYQAEKEKQEAK